MILSIVLLIVHIYTRPVAEKCYNLCISAIYIKTQVISCNKIGKQALNDCCCLLLRLLHFVFESN